MTSHYRTGADLERATKHALEDNGYYVIKSAGSKGLADLAAFKPGEILFVQCKIARNQLGPAARTSYYALCLRLGVTPLIASWLKEGRTARMVVFEELTGHHLTTRHPWTPEWATTNLERSGTDYERLSASLDALETPAAQPSPPKSPQTAAQDKAGTGAPSEAGPGHQPQEAT